MKAMSNSNSSALYPDRSLHSRVVHELGSRIVKGRIQPGETLPTEPELMLEFDVSRSVVREATKILAGKGLVETRTRRGSVVVPTESWHLLDPDVISWRYRGAANLTDLIDLIGLRHVIEPAIAGLAAIEATESDLMHMRLLFDELTKSGDDSTRFAAADRAFHKAIVDSIDNVLVRHLYELIGVGLAELRSMAIRSELHGPQNIVDHGLVLEALEARNPERSIEAMARVVAVSRVEVMEFVDSNTRSESTVVHDD